MHGRDNGDNGSSNHGLVSKNIISKGDSIKIEKQVISSGKSTEEVLEEVGVPTQTILDVKGEYYNVPSINLANYTIPISTLKYISEDAASHYKFVPLSIKEGTLEVGMVDPDNIESRDALTFIISKLNLPYKIYVIASIIVVLPELLAPTIYVIPDPVLSFSGCASCKVCSSVKHLKFFIVNFK